MPDTPLDRVNAKLKAALPPMRPVPPPPPTQVAAPTDPTTAYVAGAIADGRGYIDANGIVHVLDDLSGDWITFQKTDTGSYVATVKPGSAAEGGTDNTAGLANVGLGYAELGENTRQFDASLAQRQSEQTDSNAQYQQDFSEGQRQFDLTYNRSNFESDREYAAARDEFGRTFAETQRQFDAQYGLDSRALDLQTELGRGGLEVDRGRLALDDRLGTGRLNLDTELGRGTLRNDTARVGIERDRLGLDTELGRGRLSLDTRLGEGGLRLNAADLAFRQRSDDRAQRLNEQTFRRDVLRNPSDYVFRAFESRGETAPTARVTHADVLNGLRTAAKGGMADEPYILTGGGGPELIRNHGDGRLSIASAPQTERILGAMPGGMDALRSEVMTGAQQWGQSQNAGQGDVLTQLRALLERYRASKMMQPNSSPMEQPDMAQAAPVMSGKTGRMRQPMAAPRMGVAAPPGEPVPTRMDSNIMRPRPPQESRLSIQPVVNGYASGTDDAFFRELDQIVNYTLAPAPTFTQDELVSAAQTYSPPAVSSALAGTQPNTYRPASRGLTLRGASRLTPGEQAALNTRLGVEFNTTLEDEMAGLSTRFGPVRDRAMSRLAV